MQQCLFRGVGFQSGGLFYNGMTSDALIIFDQDLAAARLDGEEIIVFGLVCFFLILYIYIYIYLFIYFQYMNL